MVSLIGGQVIELDLQVKLVSTPDKSRAISIPNKRPDVTIDRDAALLLGGARSPTKGSMSCGVTVVTAVINEIAVKAARLLVTQTPILDTLTSVTSTSEASDRHIPHSCSEEYE